MESGEESFVESDDILAEDSDVEVQPPIVKERILSAKQHPTTPTSAR